MRSDRLYAQDILDAIDEVARYLPADRAKFDGDPLLQSHILRHVQIVGEAAYRMSQGIRAAHPQVPWRQIAGMRHILVHNYFRVDWNIVYETAADGLPALRPQVEAILATLSPERGAP
jgi:uncharacterized protein with HEPN domain